ncbi:MAG: hypothetical protein Q8N02_06610 [Methylotenera sp.]|nr:hypothetical protein [Methylotenera sp.]MDO9232879.1 hypothetical protein [Methylotenera sp.]MDO9389111.1 hypothetical protein [Methylotenera sp.]MDP2102875.1 hypothetical protein [Methylotenera sp.]MDP2282037.1 hypothetical protein [Methylotenera sp.]
MSMIDDHAFEAFLAPGVVPRDVDALFPLLQSANVIQALIALFRGGGEEVMIRLAVLREIAARADAPEWTPQQLQNHLSFIDNTKLETVLKRLREHDLLLWDGERRLYQLSGLARMILSSLSNLVSFGNQDDELGFLFSQIAAGDAVGQLNSETLTNLLARLNELESFFSQAVQSGSEFKLKAAQSRLDAAQKWMARGTEILQNLGANGFADDASWRIAQKIGDSQSRMMRMTSVFQNELAKISRQRVMLSDGGLSSSELAAWLKSLSIEKLADVCANQIALTPEPFFALPDVMVDVAETFLERDIADKKVSTMPPPAEVEETQDVPFEYPSQLQGLTNMLARIERSTTLADIVVGGDFSAASYRYSLLTFLGEQNVDADLAALAEQSVEVLHEDTSVLQVVHQNEVALMTSGTIKPINNPARSKLDGV